MVYVDRGRTVMSYLVAGILLGLVISSIAYSFGVFIRVVIGVYEAVHERALNATMGRLPGKISVSIGNETVQLTKPANPGLRSLTEPLIQVLAILSAILTNPLTLAVLIAMTMVAYALMEKG